MLRISMPRTITPLRSTKFSGIAGIVPDANPTGIYRRTFTAPRGWKGQRIVIHFGGANSLLYVFLNGRFIGLSKDAHLPAEFDLTDVPRDQFLVGGEAWRRFRAGEADPAKFGLSQLPEAGDWWIAANLMRDGAALLNIELLPWDCWGAMPPCSSSP